MRTKARRKKRKQLVTAFAKKTDAKAVMKPVEPMDKATNDLVKLIEKGPADKKTENLSRIVNEAASEEEKLTRSEVQGLKQNKGEKESEKKAQSFEDFDGSLSA